MNYMEQVAKMLGVELGEEFWVGEYDGTYIFNEIGLKCANSERYFKTIMCELLNGNAKIKRKPWRPKQGERYYSPTFGITTMYFTDTFDYGDCMCTLNLASGVIFRTKEEAVEAAKKMLKALEG